MKRMGSINSFILTVKEEGRFEQRSLGRKELFNAFKFGKVSLRPDGGILVYHRKMEIVIDRAFKDVVCSWKDSDEWNTLKKLDKKIAKDLVHSINGTTKSHMNFNNVKSMDNVKFLRSYLTDKIAA